MNNLYSHKSSNIRKTWLLMAVFLILIIALGWLFSIIFQVREILYFALGFSLLMNFFSYWYSDKIALAIAQAKPIEKKDFPELYRIVENLSITAGLPMPKVFIVNESQINAFATGRNPKNSAIAVTRGALEKLDKLELEGVLAHEISHIANRDILVATIAVVLAGVIAAVSDIFLRLTFWGRSDRERSEGALVLIIALFAAILAPLGAMLLKLAISRKREFLADASGALLTRYPEGLASALGKIALDYSPLKSASEATAHLYISNPFGADKKGILKRKENINWFIRLFMTHPPIEERIAILRGMKI